MMNFVKKVLKGILELILTIVLIGIIFYISVIMLDMGYNKFIKYLLMGVVFAICRFRTLRKMKTK